MTAENRLKKYIEEDEIYNDWLNNKSDDYSDFDKFCIQHCTDIKDLIDNNKGEAKDNYTIDYNLLCRIRQMYYELEGLKLCYERVLEKNFKKDYMNWVSKAKQCLYNTKCGNPRKQDLIDGINFAIEDLERATTIEKR